MKRSILSVLSGASAAAIAVSASGQVTIIESDFSAAEGYTDGNLQFQGAATTHGGVWLGQAPPQVDSSGTGTVSQTGGFLRNIFNQGATGGIAGADGSQEGDGASFPGTGFGVGDKVKIEQEYQFTLDLGNPNRALLASGIRENFVNGGFEAAPRVGFNVAYNPFEDGELKIYSDLTRNGFDGTHNPFGFFVEPLDAGVDNGWDGVGQNNPQDLVSDNLLFTWEAEYQGADTWTTLEMTFENLDNGTVPVQMASVDNPDSLETVTVAGSGSEGFLGFQLVRDQLSGTGPTGTTDAVKYTYTAAPVGSITGDYNDSGQVEQGDLDLVLQNWGLDTDTAGIPGGWTNDLPIGQIEQTELDGVLQNWGNTAAPDFSGSAVPEPGTLALLAGLSVIGLRRRTA